jgi:hypothetical protein
MTASILPMLPNEIIVAVFMMYCSCVVVTLVKKCFHNLRRLRHHDSSKFSPSTIKPFNGPHK